MSSTKSVSEFDTLMDGRLPEIPRFFERDGEERVERRGQMESRKSFCARWWPGDSKLFSPPAKAK